MIQGLSSAPWLGTHPSLPGLLILPANALSSRAEMLQSLKLYTDPLFIGRLRAKDEVRATFSAVLALLTWEERRRGRHRMEEGAVACWRDYCVPGPEATSLDRS